MSTIPDETSRQIKTARWIARGLSLLLLGFVLILFLFNEDLRTDPTLPTIIYLILAFSTLIAWRWEKIGGLLILVLSLVLFLGMVFQWSRMPGLLTPSWQLALAGIGLVIPFLIAGSLFLYAGQKGDVAKSEGQKMSSSSWVYLVLVVLGVLAILFFAVSFFLPVQQQMETADGRPLPMNGEMPTALPPSLKGYVILSDYIDGRWRFFMEPGRNAQAPCAQERPDFGGEVPGYTAQDIQVLKEMLDQVAPGGYLFWCTWGVPASDVLLEMHSYAEQRDIGLSVLSDVAPRATAVLPGS